MVESTFGTSLLFLILFILAYPVDLIFLSPDLSIEPECEEDGIIFSIEVISRFLSANSTFMPPG